MTHGQIFLLMFEFVTVGSAFDILWIITGLFLYYFVLKCERSLMLVVEVEENRIMMDLNCMGLEHCLKIMVHYLYATMTLPIHCRSLRSLKAVCWVFFVMNNFKICCLSAV